MIDKILAFFGLMRISKKPYMIIPPGFSLISHDEKMKIEASLNGTHKKISLSGGGGGGGGIGHAVILKRGEVVIKGNMVFFKDKKDD